MYQNSFIHAEPPGVLAGQSGSLVQAAITEYLGLGGLEQQRLVSVLEAESRAPAVSVLVRTFWDAHSCFLIGSSHGGREGKRTLIEFMRVPPNPHLLIPSHWGLAFQHRNLGGTSIQAITGQKRNC